MPLIEIAASNEASGHGSSNMEPSRRSASGVRAVATARSSAEASTPETVAPIPVARRTARPEPQAMSSRLVPGPTPTRPKIATSTSIA